MLLAQHNEQIALDINAERVAQINCGESAVEDPELECYPKEERLSLLAPTDK